MKIQTLVRWAGWGVVVSASTLTGCSATDGSAQAVVDAEESAAPRDATSLFDDERYQVHDGIVYFEGDIILGPVDKVVAQEEAALQEEAPLQEEAARTAALGGKQLQSAGVFDRSRGFQGTYPGAGTPWPGHSMSWRFATNFNLGSTTKDEDFRAAIEHFEKHTSIRFVEVTPTATGDIVVVSRTDTSSETGCASSLGRIGGLQGLNIGRSTCNVGAIIHEIGHALGLLHEHQRPDRDTYVITTGTGGNYDKATSGSVALFGDYEINSIMHYGSDQNVHRKDANGDPVLLTANRTALTDYDIRGLQLMYGAQFQSTLSAVSWGSSRLDVFARGANGGVFHQAWGGSSWMPSETTWENLGGNMIGTPEAVARTSNRLDIFIRDKTNRRLHHKSWTGSAWSPSQTGWTPVSGPLALDSDPAVVAPSSSRIDVFARLSDGSVRQNTWNGSSWSAWNNMGNVPSIGPIEAVSWGSNRIDLFTVGEDRALWHKWWDGSEWHPGQTEWESLGGYVVGKPQVVSMFPNRFDVFIKNRSGQIQTKFYEGEWEPTMTSWHTLGGDAVGHMSVEAWGGNRLDVLFQDRATGQLQQMWWDGSWHQTPINLGGLLVGAPEVVSRGNGFLDVFARGRDDAMHHKWYNGSWGPSTTGWNYHGGVMSW